MRNYTLVSASLTLILPLLVGCAGEQTPSVGDARIQTLHQELKIVDPAADGSDQSAGMVSSMAISIGSVYLEAQVAPLVVDGVQLQASDLSYKGVDAYATYASIDTGGVITKKGAVEHLRPSVCGNSSPLGLGRTLFCLTSLGSLSFPETDLFASFFDGTSLWLTGATSNETFEDKYARAYRVNLDANKNPASIAVTRELSSYAGTGITKVGSQLLVTTGTDSVNVARMGGLNVLDAATLNVTATQPYYDARSVAVDPSDATQAYVVRGATGGSAGAVAQFATNGLSTFSREIPTGGNATPESHSSVQVGRSLILTSLGAQGFRVSCKATGASLATVPAPLVSGILPERTVTNSVLAIPGYVIAANGEAGVYLYAFNKTGLTGYCSGVSLTLIGRLSLGASGTYVNGELSANSLTYVPYYDLLNLNLLSGKLIMIASGNKGLSMINLSALTISLSAVDDF